MFEFAMKFKFEVSAELAKQKHPLVLLVGRNCNYCMSTKLLITLPGACKPNNQNPVSSLMYCVFP